MMTKKAAVEKLEAQWVEPVSLTCHFVLRNLYTESSIGASYQISINLAKWFKRRFFLIGHSILSEKSSPLKPLGQMNRNLVGSMKHLWNVFCKISSFHPN
jgi:hypothetical protein